MALVAHITNVGLTEHQLVADVGDLAAFTQQLEIPRAIHGVAVHTGADQLVVLNHEFFVDAARGVAHHDFFKALATSEVASAEQINAGDFQLGAGEAAGVAANAKFGQVGGAHFALLKEGGHQTVSNATVGGALAHGVNARIGDGLQRVGDDDASVAMQTDLFRQFGVGSNACGHDHQISGDLLAVFELDGHDPSIFPSNEFLGLRAHQEPQTTCLQGFTQQATGHLVQLPLHQRARDMNHGHLHAAQHQTIGRFQAQQTTADDHRMLVHLGGFDHGVGIGNVAVGDHAGQVFAGDGQDEGVGAGGNQQAVVLCLGAVFGDHHTAATIHVHHFFAQVQGDAVLFVPTQRVEHDLIQCLFAGQHRAEQDAVVVGVGLGTEDSDVVEIGFNF